MAIFGKNEIVKIILILAIIGAGFMYLKDSSVTVNLSLTHGMTELKTVPFGVNNPFTEDDQGNLPKDTSDLLKDLGVSWVSDSIFRRRVEVEPFVYDWSSTDNKIKEYKNEADLKILFTINPKSNYEHGDGREFSNNSYFPRGTQSFSAYEHYITELVARYKDKVDMWEVFNEPAAEYKKHVNDYVKLAGRTYEIIKSIDPQALVSIGGAGAGQRLSFHEEVLDGLRREYPEIVEDLWFDYHTYSWNYEDYDKKKVRRTEIGCKVIFTKTHKDYADLLRNAGWSEEQIATQIINKENGTHSGEFKDQNQPYKCYPTQTEAQQAEFLFKQAIHQLGNKVRIVFWSTLGEKSRYKSDCYNRFNFTGLIYDGTADSCGKDKDSYDAGAGVKKLSYYTYKFLIEKLKDSNFDTVNVINTGIPNVYLYEFNKPENLVYIAWWDYFAKGESGEVKQATLVLPDTNASQVKITQAIPDFSKDFQTKKGKLREKNYPNFFGSSFKTIKNDGKLTVILDKNPIYIEGDKKGETHSSFDIINPGKSELVSPNSKETIVADPGDLNNIKHAYFYINNKKHKGRKDKKGKGFYYLKWKVPYGFAEEYSIEVQALDKNNNIIGTDEVTVYSDNAPDISITSPKDNEVFSPKQKIAVNAEVLPNNNGIIKVEFYIYNDNKLIKKQIDRKAPYVFNWKLPKTPNTEYEIQAKTFTKNGFLIPNIASESKTTKITIE